MRKNGDRQLTVRPSNSDVIHEAVTDAVSTEVEGISEGEENEREGKQNLAAVSAVY